MTIWIILAIVIILTIVYITTYNDLQNAKVYTEESWSQIDVQLKRRNGLIPNLVETVRGYVVHEKETLSQIVELRNQLAQVPADDHEEKMKVSNQITDSLKIISTLNEAYLDLKANQGFGKLMEEPINTENRIAYSRQLYNSSAALYDRRLLTFPSDIVTNIHHFAKVEYLVTPEAEKGAPKVSFKD